MSWNTSNFTCIWVFNTNRGLSVCVRLPHNVGKTDPKCDF
jgi:hypothetical protein